MCVGAGGREAALFTYEIFQMYQRCAITILLGAFWIVVKPQYCVLRFAVFNKWRFEALETDRSDEGGYKVRGGDSTVWWKVLMAFLHNRAAELHEIVSECSHQ